ncbi:MAG TPA: ribonuclease III [Actinobacteria bacterium]|nr:ribonuclease III [Actinomycetota bacterium]
MARSPAALVAAALGHAFDSEELLIEALTHRSLAAEEPGEVSNERLEFLGDAVLGLIVATELHTRYSLTEGEMSMTRAAVVNESTLASLADSLGVGGALRLGKGEDASGGRRKPPILADALEALIGAIYLDAGFKKARKVVLRHWSSVIDERAVSPGERDYKTRLQEVLAQSGTAPEYAIVASGPDHERTFRATVVIAGKVSGVGSGTSKKRAQQAAARRALEALGEDA